MLRLTFKTVQDQASEAVGAEAFVLRKGQLRTSDEQLIARHVAEYWYAEGRRFIQFDCGPSVVCVIGAGESAEERHGPFQRVTCVDGVLWGDTYAMAALKDDAWVSRSTGRVCTEIRLIGG
jgi:hypothetical protein